MVNLQNSKIIKEKEEFKEDFINLNTIYRILRKRIKLIKVTSVFVFSLSIFYTAYTRIYKPIYKGDFVLLIENPIDQNSSNSSGEVSMFEQLALGKKNNDIPTLVTLLKSPNLLNQVAKENNLNPASLSRMISIDQRLDDATNNKFKRPRGILKITLGISDQKKGEKILKDLSSTYLQVALEERQKQLKDGLKFLEAQEPIIQKRFFDLQDKVEIFRLKNSIFDPIKESENLRLLQLELEDQKYTLKIYEKQLIDLKKKVENNTISVKGFKTILNPSNSDGNINNGLAVTTIDDSFLNEFVELEAELSRARLKFTDNSDVVLSIKRKMNSIKPLIKEKQLNAVETALEFNKAEVESTEEKIKELNKDLLKNIMLIKEYSSINQQLLLANDNLAGFITVKEQFKLEIAQKSIPWRVIKDPEMGSKPVYPNIPRNILLGLILSIFSGFIFALLRDRLNSIYSSIEDIKEEFNYPILAEIPFVKAFKEIRSSNKSFEFFDDEFLDDESSDKDDKEIGEQKYERFFFQESFRTLASSINLLNVNNKLKNLTITSSVPIEGKSLINLLFAKTLAQLGEKVLLIDLDLRKSVLHKRLGIDNIIGITNYLTDKKIKKEEIINKVKGFESFDFIPAGLKSPDPARLLSSQRFKDFMIDVRENYDFVIVDAPPVIQIADTSILSDTLDGVILLIVVGHTPKKLPSIAIEKITKFNAEFLGILINSITPSNNADKDQTYSIYEQYALNTDDEDSEEEIIKDEDLDNTNLGEFSFYKSFLNTVKKKVDAFFKWVDN